MCHKTENDTATEAQVIINMDIRNLIDSDKTDLSQAEIHYSSDEQGIPFGLTLEITPFFADEIEDVKKSWVQSGVPKSYLKNEKFSF